MPVEINDELVAHVARLSRLAVRPEEVPEIREQFERIVRYFEKLEELDTSGVEPSIFAVDLANILREDGARPSLPVEDALRNGPLRDEHYFRVPLIVSPGAEGSSA